jgi:hypothetical protein
MVSGAYHVSAFTDQDYRDWSNTESSEPASQSGNISLMASIMLILHLRQPGGVCSRKPRSKSVLSPTRQVMLLSFKVVIWLSKLNHIKESDNVSLPRKYPSAPCTETGYMERQAKSFITAISAAATSIDQITQDHAAPIFRRKSDRVST